MGMQQTQKFLERRVVVVAPPIGDIADAGRPVAITDLAEENTRQDVAGRGLTRQRDAAVTVHHAENVFAMGLLISTS